MIRRLWLELWLSLREALRQKMGQATFPLHSHQLGPYAQLAMPRIPRGQVAGHAYHVLNRGNGDNPNCNNGSLPRWDSNPRYGPGGGPAKPQKSSLSPFSPAIARPDPFFMQSYSLPDRLAQWRPPIRTISHFAVSRRNKTLS